MRILVISDVHANLTALEEVLADAGEVDGVWCLGDLVGYGPDPNECIERIRRLPNLTCVLGNHDAAVLGRLEFEVFNQDARSALQWTQETLSEASWRFLKSLPERVVIGEVTLVHGSPRQPVWEYLLDLQTVHDNFRFFDTPFCFVGHTHLPTIFHRGALDIFPFAGYLPPNQAIQLTPREIVNPGSVGQPRDRDPRAAYALYDTETRVFEHRRVTYDIAAVQERMRKARLPLRHIERLSLGW
ncbi:MAG: metallophosphoesterase family protein [Anaerolineales bacterium]|nr:metallophosphatase family protein [Anaerolineales bacterium]MCS7248646.1 metallophosphatase family protein [Anaerolineales bacterium]MDW8162459.1 metallophosphoesterase family protein [Anaerolineales bacterium]MDW8447894.1 metallophosphoesterase family protein [Anaerolineales bacterium]